MEYPDPEAEERREAKRKKRKGDDFIASESEDEKSKAKAKKKKKKANRMSSCTILTPTVNKNSSCVLIAGLLILMKVGFMNLL